MDNMHDEFWNDLLPDIREALGLRYLTIEESAKAYADATPVELGDSDIQWLMDQSITEIPQEPGFDNGPDVPKTILEGFMQLNREEGESDPEVDAFIQRQRDDALDQDRNDETDKPELD